MQGGYSVKAYIKALRAFVPPNRVSNEELCKTVDSSDEWIVSHTGVNFRHMADENTATSDIAIAASKLALNDAGVDPADLDLIILATATQDYPGFPSTACIVQDQLGAVKSGAMDISAACTGFIYGLETAKSYILSESAERILVIGAETLSKILNWNDRDCVLFGDGGGAAIVTKNDINDESGIIWSTLRAEGDGSHHLIRRAGGSRHTFHMHAIKEEDLFVKMNGRQVYTFAVRVLCDTIKVLLENNNLSLEDIDYVVPHQANLRIIEAASKRLSIPMEKFYVNIQEYANTSAGSIPIALDEMNKKGMLKRGNKLLTIAFGGGLTYGGNYIVW